MSSLSPSFQIHLFAAASPGQTASEAMLAITFDLLAERLQKFERLHFEMDGSFVWTGAAPNDEPNDEPSDEPSDESRHWLLDGMLYDQRQQIQRIELKGRCPHLEWRKLLAATDYPLQSLIAYDLKSRSMVSVESLESTLWSPPSA